MHGCRRCQKHQRSEPSIYFLIYAPVDDSIRKVADSLVNDLQKNNVDDHNTYKISTTIMNKREQKKQVHYYNKIKNPPNNANRKTNDSVQIHKNLVNTGELKVQKHLNKTAYTSNRSRAADNTAKGPYRRNHQYHSIPINTINPHVNNNDSAEGSVSQNCPIPTRITQREQTSKIHRGMSRKRYSHYKYKKLYNVTSQENDHFDEVFRTGSRWKTNMKCFQLYY